MKIYIDKYCKDWAEEEFIDSQYAASDGKDWFLSEDCINWTKAETML